MEHIIGPLFPLSFLLALAVERLLQTGEQPKVRYWRVKGTLFFAIGGLINALVPGMLAPLLSKAAYFDLSGLPLAIGVSLVFLLTSLLDYWLHRTMHLVPAVWRWAHQMHHSAERVDIAGFAYSHPTELTLSVLTATTLGALLGASPDAILLGGFAWYLSQLFLHMNIRTPHFIGLFLQRPEAHRVHHTRGIHAYNYGLPLWDALFGTRQNPVQWNREYGFWDGASRQVLPMLFGKDVAELPEDRGVAASHPPSQSVEV